MFSKPMKPIEEDKIMAELLKAKVKTISKPIRDKDYQIEKVIRKNGTEQTNILRNEKLLKEYLEIVPTKSIITGWYLNHHITKSQLFIAENCMKTVPMDLTFGNDIKEKISIFTIFLHKMEEIAKILLIKEQFLHILKHTFNNCDLTKILQHEFNFHNI